MLRFYFKFILKQKFRFIFLIALISFYWPLDFILSPYLNKIFIDGISLGTDFIIPLVMLVIVKSIFKIGEKVYSIFWAKFITNIQKDMRAYLFTYTHKHSKAFFTKNLSGSISRLILDSADKCWNSFDLIITILPLTINIILTFYLTIRVNLFFGIIFLIWLTIHMAISLMFSDKLIKYSQRHLSSFLELSGKISDSLSNNFIIHIFSSIKYERKYVEKFQEVEQINKEEAIKAGVYLNLVLNTLEILIFIFSMVMLLKFKANDKVTLGDFLLISGLYNNFAVLLYSISNKAIVSIQDFYATKQALKTILSPYEIEEGTKILEFTKGKIEFKNVSFSYGEENILKNFNLVINPGERVALLGNTGAGKSTIISLLLREFDPTEGSIEIDNQNIKDVTLKSLRKVISIVNQEPKCFNRSLAENISYSKDIPRDKILEAAKKVHLDSFINSLPNGLDFIIEENGNNISMGERRKVELARAILDNAPMIVFDEVLSNIEYDNTVMEEYNNLMSNKTVLVLDSKVYSAVNLDRIFILEDGEIVEKGTHKDLIDRKGIYSRMVEKDFNING